MAQLGPRTSRISCEHSDHWATKPQVDLWQFPPTYLDLSPNLNGTMLELIRQSFCCSQPEHRPTLATNCHRGEKKHMARPSLKPRTSRIPSKHSDHWATEPHGRPVTYPLVTNGITRYTDASFQSQTTYKIDLNIPIFFAGLEEYHTFKVWITIRWKKISIVMYFRGLKKKLTLEKIVYAGLLDRWACAWESKDIFWPYLCDSNFVKIIITV